MYVYPPLLCDYLDSADNTLKMQNSKQDDIRIHTHQCYT